MFTKPVALLVLFALSTVANAQIEVADAWVRASVPRQHATGAFMRITATQSRLRLLSASSAVAETTEIHQMSMEGDIARMQRIDGLTIEAGASVELRPGGYHLMLMGLPRPLQPGSRVPLELRFEHAGEERTIRFDAEVRPLAAGTGSRGHH